jgi:hypothetical protein
VRRELGRAAGTEEVGGVPGHWRRQHPVASPNPKTGDRLSQRFVSRPCATAVQATVRYKFPIFGLCVPAAGVEADPRLRVRSALHLKDTATRTAGPAQVPPTLSLKSGRSFSCLAPSRQDRDFAAAVGWLGRKAGRTGSGAPHVEPQVRPFIFPSRKTVMPNAGAAIAKVALFRPRDKALQGLGLASGPPNAIFGAR